MCGPLAARTVIIEGRRVSNWTVDIIINVSHKLETISPQWD